MSRRRTLTLVFLLCSLSVPSTAQELPNAKAAPQIPLQHKDRKQLRLKHDSFTFVRIKYSARNRRTGSWATDYPDSDLALSARLQKETGLKTQPQGVVLTLTDPKLRKLPFAYLAEGGNLLLSDDEADGLRNYLEGGGFLMVDDFWGEDEWTNLSLQIQKTFPHHKFIELPLDHPVFSAFYTIHEKPQVPSIHLVLSQNTRQTGVTWERGDAKEAHYRGLIDGQGRLMAIFCHNTDLGDGWEREGVDEYYTQEFVLKRALPMGINIVVYALSQ